MKTLKELHEMAGQEEWYPDLDALIDLCVVDLLKHYDEPEALHMVRDVFAGLARADIRGFVAAGDEHEWAAVAVRAAERAMEEELK